MSVAVREYTDASAMLADYAERRRRLYSKRTLVRVVDPVDLAPTGETSAEPPPETPARLSARQILHDTCQRHGLKAESVLGGRRYKPLVLCRREAAWLIAKETSLSLPQIAAIMNKDHTSILMAIRRQNEETGTNVRNCGGIPEKTRERNRASAAKRKGLQKTLRERMRLSEMTRNREDFRQ